MRQTTIELKGKIDKFTTKDFNTLLSVIDQYWQNMSKDIADLNITRP